MVSWPVAALVIIVCVLGSNMPTALYGVLRGEIGFSAATQTAIFGAYMVGVLPGLLVVGPLSDRLGRRPILMVALIVTFMASAGFLFADSVLTLVVIRLLQGLSVGAATVAGVACIFATMSAHRVALAALLAAAATAVGAALGPPVGGLVAELFGRSVIAPYVLELGLVAVTAGFLLFAPSPRSAPTSTRDVAAADPAGEPRSSMTMTCLLAGLSWVVVGLFQAVGPALLSESLGITHLGVLGLAVALVMTASTITSMLARRWPAARLRGAGLVLLVIGCAALALTLTTGSAVIAGAAAIAIGIAHGLVFLGATRDLNVLSAARRTGTSVLATGVFYTSAYLGSAAPTLGVGLLADSVGLTRAALVLLAVVAALAALLGAREALRWWAFRPNRDDPAQPGGLTPRGDTNPRRASKQGGSAEAVESSAGRVMAR